jgi:hypothetical protein
MEGDISPHVPRVLNHTQLYKVRPMSESNEEISDQFTQSFAKVLSGHGYGFQFSVLKKAEEVIKKLLRVQWIFEACEFPVEVQGAGTRIDFILCRTSRGSLAPPLFLVAECKRANPALSNWCFIRAPYTHSAASNELARDNMIMESLIGEGDIQIRTLRTSARRIFSSNAIYHVAVEVRSNVAGDHSGETGQAIERAATQVSRSLNGFIETMVQEPQIMDEAKRIDFLPVIFTTANLYVSEADLSQSDLHTGNITLKKEEVKAVPWLFYQYALSPGLKHSIPSREKGNSIATLLQWGYLRTIPIVSASGIEQFLIWASSLDTRQP